MNAQAQVSAANKDKEAFAAIREASHQEQLVFAARKSGRSVLSIQRDFMRLSRQSTKINMTEYLLHGLFYTDRYTEEERSAFIGNNVHWPITHSCNDPSWQASTEDKVIADTILKAGGVAVPDSLAVIDRTQRLYPQLKQISSADHLRAFCVEHAENGIFGKIIDGMIGFGALRIDAADEDGLQCFGHNKMSYHDFLENVVGDNKYLLQRRLFNHDKIAPFATALATVRMVNLVDDANVIVPVAAMALSQGNNIADAFWRDDNIACAIDVPTGRLTTVAQRNLHEIEYLDDHPSVPGLKGLVLPYWDELCDMNARAARLFTPIRYQSTDIAITNDGPVVVEINYGSGFGLPQQAAGRGMLTPEVRAFFEANGWSFGGRSKNKRSLFGRKKG